MDNIVIPIISILFSGATSAFVANIYSRRNLKSSQYISIITSERIKWIQDVRNDFSILLSSVILHLLNSDKIINESAFTITHELVDVLGEEEVEIMADDFKRKKLVSDVIQPEFKNALSKREIVEKSILLKMKLNPKEDVEIIYILNDIIDIFSNVSLDVSNQSIRYDYLVEKCQYMFKREWEKVKDETRTK